MPDVVTPGWFDFRPLAGPHAVAGRERQALSGCLDLRRIFKIRDGGVPRHPPGWRPRLPRCIEGCRLWSGLAGLGGSPNVGICLTPSATRLSRHVRRSPSSSSIWRLDGSPPVRGWTSAHPGPLSSEGPSTAGWGNISNARSSPWIRLVRAQHYPGPSWRVRAGQCGLASNPTRDRRR